MRAEYHFPGGMERQSNAGWDDRGNFEKKQDPDSGMKKGTIVCCKEVGKAISTKGW